MANRDKKEIKGIQIGKVKVKFSLFAGENPKDATEKYYGISRNLANLQDKKLIHRNLLHFYALTMKDQKGKLRKQSHLPSCPKE